MDWLQTLLDADAALFQAINKGMSNPLFDAVLPLCREKWIWAPLYLFIAAFAVLNFGKKGRLILFGLVLAVGISDSVSSALVKKQVQRLRPCNEPALSAVIIRRVPCGSGYSFTSSHAANHFAVAVFLIGMFGTLARWVRPFLLSWAFLVAFAQVYVGLHYPGDVLGGALLGVLAGWGVAKFVLHKA